MTILTIIITILYLLLGVIIFSVLTSSPEERGEVVSGQIILVGAIVVWPAILLFMLFNVIWNEIVRGGK
jgi:hypothetical protein